MSNPGRATSNHVRLWIARKILPAGYSVCLTGRKGAPKVRDVL